jgi:hypothetical protein
MCKEFQCNIIQNVLNTLLIALTLSVGPGLIHRLFNDTLSAANIIWH